MAINQTWDVIVIGAGAAGMMCAAQAGQRGRRVLLLDHSRKLGEKIRISGGGHCNFTNLHCGPENFLSENPHFCRSALTRFTPRHFIDLVERYGIAYHEKTLGQLFCDGSAVQIIELLKSECELGNVTWQMDCAIEQVHQENGIFHLKTSQGSFESAALVVATGGLAVPKIGASPFAYQLAKQFGLAVVSQRPGLVPLALEPEALAAFGDLSGISLPVEVSCNQGRFRESMLFTHHGLSGPAILQISSYWKSGDFISINLLPDRDIVEWLHSHHSSRAQVANLLAEALPRRFAQQWCAAHGLEKLMCHLTHTELNLLAESLGCWRLRPSGTLGYNKAEVTLGGVDTHGLSSKTMESNSVPGLYFIGEAVDVTGHLGGFNFQWAWASGHAAGLAV
jgi:predicted Rossmann fold flavoprotein